MQKPHEDPAPICLEVRHLRLVRAIAREKTLTHAARMLHLSQSAVSHQLIDLERALATRLFDRVGKRMVLTTAGAALVEGSYRVLRDLADVEQSVTALCRDGRASLRVTTSCYTSYGWLPGALTQFRRSYPRVDLTIVLEATRRALDALAGDDVDLAIVTDPPKDDAWQVTPIVATELVVVARRDHPVVSKGGANRGSVRWSELRGAQVFVHDAPEPLLARLERAVRDGWEQESGERLAHAVLVQKIPVTEALIELAVAGAGVVLADHWLIAHQAVGRGLVTLPVAPSFGRTFFAVWRAANPRRLPLDQLAGVIRGEAERHVRARTGRVRRSKASTHPQTTRRSLAGRTR